MQVFVVFFLVSNVTCPCFGSVVQPGFHELLHVFLCGAMCRVFLLGLADRPPSIAICVCFFVFVFVMPCAWLFDWFSRNATITGYMCWFVVFCVFLCYVHGFLWFSRQAATGCYMFFCFVLMMLRA